MKFKLVENYKITRSAIQEYAYDAIEELGNASLEEYIQWFSELSEYFDDEVKQAVKDFYIEAIDCGKIDQPKTMITSELTTYLESNSELIDKDIDELIDNCPAHLKHELKIVLSKLDESLTESKTKMKSEVTSQIYDLFKLLTIPEYDENKRTTSGGQTSLKLYLLQNSGKSTNGDLSDIVVHHINGKHNDYSADNVCLLSRADHNSIHKECFTEVLNEYNQSNRVTKKKELQKLTVDDFPPDVLNDLFDNYLIKMRDKIKDKRIDK